MLTFCLGRSRKIQELFFVQIRSKGQNITDFQLSIGQRTGFIKGDGIDLAHLLQRFAGFDNYAVFGSLPDGSHNRRGGCQHQRTGAEYHKHRYRTDNVLRCNTGNGCNQHRHRDKPACDPVGNSCHGRFFVLRFLHHANELLQGAVLANLCCTDVDCAETIDGPAEHRVSGCLIYWQRFTGHNRLVNGGFTAYNDTVHRNGFSGQDSEHIALDDLLSRNHFFLSVPNAPFLRRSETDELFQSLLCPVRGGVLQKRTDCHDESDFTGGEQVANGNGSKHGNGNQKSR